MIKRLFSFLCCLVPLGAGAVTFNPETGNAVGGDGSLTGINYGDETVVIQSGNGIVVGDGGITVKNNMYIGMNSQGGAADTGQLYAETGIDPVFTIRSDGNISVGAILQVLDGYELGIGSKTAGNTIDISLGALDADGKFSAENINSFTVTGAIDSANGLSISANTITSGAITATGGDVNINANGALNMAQFSFAGGGTANVQAGTIASGSIQNQSGSTMNIKLSGNLNSTGNIENKGDAMTIGRQNSTDVVDVTVAGTMTNESGTMTLNVDNLTVNGGDADNPSFINKGNLNATVAGETNLAYGFDLSAMTADNTFHLDTGTLVFGNGYDADAWLKVFANKLNSFNLIVRQGNISVADIVNGFAGNSNANMTLMAREITADSIENRGDNLIIKTIDTTETPYTAPTNDKILVNGALTGLANSNTEIITGGTMTVAGNVSNAGTMVLNGNIINLAGVSNDGGTLEIAAYTDNSGRIVINNNVTNTTGDMLISAREIDINGILTNNSGTTTIRGSDTSGGSMTIGGIDVLGGTVNLNALVGAATITNGLSVTGGAFNVGADTYALTVGDSVQINGNVTVGNVAAVGIGNMNIAASGARAFVLKSENGTMTIDGDISATDAAVARRAIFDAATIDVGGDVFASGQGWLTFGSQINEGVDARANTFNTNSSLTINGSVQALDGGTVEFYSNDIDVGEMSNNATGKFIVHGSQITANTGAINIAGGIWFDGTNNASGMIVKDTNNLTLKTTTAGSDVDVSGGIAVGGGNTLTLDSANNVAVSGLINSTGVLDIKAVNAATFDNSVANNGTLTVNAASISGHDITNTSVASLTATDDITVGNVTNSDDLTISGANLIAGAIESTAGVIDITAQNVDAAFLNITGGKANVNSAHIAVSNDIAVSGDLMQGGTASGMLNLTQDNLNLTANNLTVGGDFAANSNTAAYDITNNVNITGNVSVANGAETIINAGNTISAADITNNGNLQLIAQNGFNLGTVVNNAGNILLGSGNAISTLNSFVINAGTAELSGLGMTSAGAFNTTGMLYQNYAGTLQDKDININSSDYTLTASNVKVSGISQKSGALILNTSDITVGGNIDALDLRIAANPSTDWLNVAVTGNVSGGVDFIGLEQMTINGNYVFSNNSKLHAAILPYATEIGANTSTRNYWSSISLNDDGTLGTITNASDGQALIQVGDKFVSDVSGFGNGSNNGALKDGQMGIDLFDIVDQGTAIWLLHTDNGIQELGDKIRNLNINFCNADGSMCFNYLDSLDTNNGSDEDLPAYLSVRDTDGDGIPDSLYVVFDPRFGGPVEVFKIQPIVGRTDTHTNAEYVSAGALDDLIYGQLQNTGFYNRTPIEVIPVMFKGTNMETLAKELYNRMEYYEMNRDGTALARFSRLFQARELEQIAGSIALNEHTSFRSFEDRMFDEFIWNRNRNLKKAWLDVDFGMFNQDVSDGKRVDGNRFMISGGFDWQENPTLILGLTGRVSHMSSDNFDEMDLGYRPNESIAGRVSMNVADTNIGLGGYLMKTFGTKTRVYGNAFLDVHVLDVSRDQNFVAPIDGNGTAFSLISEWGLLHDWLNQYIVGNMYVRAGYNFGFNVKEKAAGHDYMNLESDGYLVLTPGYSLMAQKRIYPSAWFQIRPYASIGVEYDVLGMPDSVKYKFAPAHTFTKYDIDIDPLWANIGGGVELLSASGIQIGLDYRYQYNSEIQLHNIKVSGSYRF